MGTLPVTTAGHPQRVASWEHQKWLRFKLLVNRVMEEREAAIEAAWHAFLADHRHAYGLSLKMQLSQEVTRQWHQCRENLVTTASPALPMHERRLRSVMDRAFLGIRKQAIRLSPLQNL